MSSRNLLLYNFLISMEINAKNMEVYSDIEALLAQNATKILCNKIYFFT